MEGSSVLPRAHFDNPGTPSFLKPGIRVGYFRGIIQAPRWTRRDFSTREVITAARAEIMILGNAAGFSLF